MIRSCNKCKWFDDKSERRSGDGLCKISPPAARRGWPYVFSDDWCGKFENRFREIELRNIRLPQPAPGKTSGRGSWTWTDVIPILVVVAFAAFAISQLYFFAAVEGVIGK